MRRESFVHAHTVLHTHTHRFMYVHVQCQLVSNWILHTHTHTHIMTYVSKLNNPYYLQMYTCVCSLKVQVSHVHVQYIIMFRTFILPYLHWQFLPQKVQESTLPLSLTYIMSTHMYTYTANSI